MITMYTYIELVMNENGAILNSNLVLKRINFGERQSKFFKYLLF